MTSAFISYSRRDQLIALKVQEALKARGRTIWIDQRGIEPTEQWKQAIYQAIDETDAFLYMLSPDALTSRFCAEELKYALANKKRIIPIVVRNVDMQDVVEQVAEKQWIVCSEETDFSQAIEEILIALDIDHEYRHLGSHLLVRARRWESNGHKRGLLPRSEVKEAEQWLVASTNKSQGATEAHIRFISASQHRASLLQWTITGISLFFAIMIGSLGIFSYWQAQVAQAERGDALIQRNTALDQRNQAVMREAHLLATQVESALNNHQPDLALLLSLRAIKIHDDNITRESLIQALEYSPRIIRVMHGHNATNAISQTRGNGTTTGITGLAFSPDGQTLISAGANDGNIIRWNITQGWERHPIALAPFRHGYGISGIALSPDGKQIASIGDDGIWLWNAQTGAQLAELERDTDTIHYGVNQFWPDSPLPIQFSHNGKILVASKCESNPCTRTKILLWDVASKKPLIPPLLVSGNIQDLAFSPDGKILALAGCMHLAPGTTTICTQGQIELWNTATWKPLAPPLPDHAGSVWSLAFNFKGDLLASGGSDNTINLWNIATRRLDGIPLTGHAGPITRLAFSPDGSRLASASQDKRIILWDIKTHHPVDYNLYHTSNNGILIGHSAEILSLAFSPDGQQLVSGDANNTLIVWSTDKDIATSYRINTPVSQRMLNRNALESVAFSPDGHTLATGSVEGIIEFWNTTIRNKPWGLSIKRCSEWDRAPCIIVGLAYTSGGNVLIAATADGTIYDIDLTSQTLLGKPMKESIACASTFCSEGDVYSMALSNDGTLVATGGCSTIPKHVGFQVECSQGEIWLWNRTTRQVVFHLKGHQNFVTGLAFSPDGKTLASASTDRTVLLWDVATGKQTNKHFSGQDSVAFSPNRGILAAYQVNDTVKTWDTKTGHTGTQYITPHTGTTSQNFRAAWMRFKRLPGDIVAEQLLTNLEDHGHMAFSPDGKRLAIAAWDHTISVWDTTNTQSAVVPTFYAPGQINAIAFSPNGQQIVSVDDEGHAILWELNIHSWQNSACQIAARNFTADEQRQFSLETSQICQNRSIDTSVVQEELTQAHTIAQDNAGHPSANTILYTHITQEAIQTDDALLNNQVCLDGSLDHFARSVLAACDHALALEPDNGMYHNSRGIARALTGDTHGAIEDFTYFINWIQRNNLYGDQNHIQARDTWLQERRNWIWALKFGHNPFDVKTLKALQDEQFSLNLNPICYLNSNTGCELTPT